MNHLGLLFKRRLLDSVCSRPGLRFCIFNNLPGDADDAMTILWVARGGWTGSLWLTFCWLMLSHKFLQFSLQFLVGKGGQIPLQYTRKVSGQEYVSRRGEASRLQESQAGVSGETGGTQSTLCWSTSHSICSAQSPQHRSLLSLPHLPFWVRFASSVPPYWNCLFTCMSHQVDQTLSKKDLIQLCVLSTWHNAWHIVGT